jgi:hypothetical protein
LRLFGRSLVFDSDFDAAASGLIAMDSQVAGGVDPSEVESSVVHLIQTRSASE